MVARVLDVTVSIPAGLIWFIAGAAVMLIVIIALAAAMGGDDAP
jgi:hypothetical protein